MGDLFGPKYSLAVAYSLFSAGCLASYAIILPLVTLNRTP